MNLYQITFTVEGRPQCWLRYSKDIKSAKKSAKRAIKAEYNLSPINLSIKEMAQYFKYIKSDMVLKIGEFQLIQYTDNSILIKKEDGEGIELSLETIRDIWGKYY